MSNIVQFNQLVRVIRINEMISLLGCSRSSLHRWVKQGSFPQPKMMGKKTIGWLESDYISWLEQKTYPVL